MPGCGVSRREGGPDVPNFVEGFPGCAYRLFAAARAADFAAQSTQLRGELETKLEVDLAKWFS